MLRLTLVLMLTIASGVARDAMRFDEVLKAYARDNRFIGSVLVANEDAVLFQQSVGFANAEWEIPNSATTRFRLGSVTKQFTAAAILLLNEQGKLRLEDPLSKLLPTTPAAWAQVTVRQLLSHTSGVPSFTEAKEYARWKLSSEGPAAIIAHIADKPLDFAPGEKFHYSNTGYLLLGWIVAEVSGQPYETFLRERIFGPLGMRNTGCDSNSELIPQRATGYTPGPHGFLNAAYIDMHVPGGAGALYSTTGDLLRWTRGLFGGKLLKPESLEQMIAPVKSNYGFGLTIAERKGRKVIAHGGGIEGFSSHVAYYPETKVTIVVLSNLESGNAGAVAGALAAVHFGESPTLPAEHKATSLPRETLQKYVGTYRLAPTFAITVALSGDRLTAQATGQPAFPITPETETRFFLTGVDAQVEFVTDTTGAATHLILHQGGRETKGPREL